MTQPSAKRELFPADNELPAHIQALLLEFLLLSALQHHNARDVAILEALLEEVEELEAAATEE
jgi:hypothetical protein